MEKPTFRKLVQLAVLCLLISQQVGCATPAGPVVAPPTATPTATFPSSTLTSTPTLRAESPLGEAWNVKPETLTATPTPTRTPSPRKAETTMRDITYCAPDGMGLKMDIYLPPKTDAGPSPVVLWVHGGSWSSGDKSSGDGVADFYELLQRGYALAAINYRHAPKFKFPAQIEDVKCAVRYLHAKAADYDIDPRRIGAWGSSAGGYLVTFLGVTDANAGLEGNGGYADQSSRVQAVVDMFGRSDLTMTFNDRMAQMAQDVFGAKSAQDPILVRASPVTYITPDDPPFLILQGEKDDVVPPIHSQVLYDKLKAAGVPATLVMVKNAGHGFASVGGAISPSRAELTKMIVDFFDQHLKR